MTVDIDRFLAEAGVALELNAYERRMVGAVLDAYGLSLGRILLTGLGEAWDVRDCRYEITGRWGRDRDEPVEVLLSSCGGVDFPPRLPRGKEPLVLAALLYVRARKLEEDGNWVRFPPWFISELLGWERDEGAGLMLEALGRYSRLSFHVCRQWWDEEERTAFHVEQSGRLFDDYQLSVAPGAGGLTFHVSFDELFMDLLAGGLLFDVYMDLARDVRRAE